MPLAIDRPRRVDGATPEVPPKGEVAGVVALVIENDEAVRMALVGLLETWGVSALDSASAGEALGLLADLGIAPDVILADFHLEDERDGLEAIAACRAEHGVIPAILVTADRGRALADRCASLGIPLVNKPVEPARLYELLARCHHRLPGPR